MLSANIAMTELSEVRPNAAREGKMARKVQGARVSVPYIVKGVPGVLIPAT